MSAFWSVYMVSCADDTLYTGITTDINTRINRHNAGKASKYTRARLPVLLVYLEKVGKQSDALRREREIKKLTRKAKWKLVKGAENAVQEVRRVAEHPVPRVS
jgi:putative endonuclease